MLTSSADGADPPVAAGRGWTEDLVKASRLVPVIVIDDVDVASRLGATLVENGLPIAEVTLRTPAAVGAIEQMAEIPGLLVGAGTVLTVEQVDRAARAGARFIVSPGFDADVVRRSLELDLLPIPGVATATEVQAALRVGAALLKFFPAGPLGGPVALRALAAPFRNVRFVPTGGIGPEDLTAYLELDCVAAVGGSFMVPPVALRVGNHREIGRQVRDAVTRVTEATRTATAT